MTAPLSYVYDGRRCIGFLLRRGKCGVEAFDRDERPLGLFETASAAANAIFAGASTEAGANSR